MARSSSSNSLQIFDDVASRIKHGSQTNKYSKLLVEGPGDLKILESLVGEVEIFICGGRPNVISGVSKLIELNYKETNFIGIYDRDFIDDVQSAVECLNSHLAPYEFRDLECMLINNGVTDKILNNFGSPSKISQRNDVDDILSGVMESATYVALIRAASIKYNWGVNFDGIDLARKFDKKSFRIKRDPLIDSVISASSVPLTRDLILSKINDLSVDELGPRGKDYLTLLGVCLVGPLGSLNGGQASPEMMVRYAHAYAFEILHDHSWIDFIKSKLLC